MLISNAYAQAAAGGADAGLLNIGMLVLMLVVFYFILIRPQMKRAKEHKAMLEALDKGSEVVTAGGIVGKITKIADGYITLEVSPNVEMTFQKQAVQTLLPKGSIKAL
jgi:preprotein translocase subunit YajC